MRTKRILKWIGLIVGIFILLAIGFGLYLKSIIPKSVGTPTVLQAGLFDKPAQPFPMEGRYIFKSAHELAAMIRHQEATSEDIVKEFLANIKNNNWKYKAIIWLREEEALQEARMADEAVAKGDTLDKPLLGVPVTLKEMYWVKGSPSTMNAKMFGFTAPEDGPLARQMKGAGAIILGTTNVPFMLSDYQTHGEVYPTASNPYDTTRTPGGSTGGGAAALAAGFTTLEIGSDLGGSIRIPAAFCGLYGLKPSLGAINITQGTGPDTTTKYTRFALASGGPLARDLEDLELLWHVLKNVPPDPRFPSPVETIPASDKTLDQYRLAWMDQWVREKGSIHVGNDVVSKMKMLADSLAGHGVKMSHDAPPVLDDMLRNFMASFAGMMGENQPWLIRKFIAIDFAKFDDGSGIYENFKETIMDPTDTRWVEILEQRKDLIEAWDVFFKSYDFFICPVTYGPAIHKCPQGSKLEGDHGQMMTYLDYFTCSPAFNATGHPSLSVPLGLNADGLPVGVQIVGPYHSEEEILHLARLISPYTQGFVKPAQL